MGKVGTLISLPNISNDRERGNNYCEYCHFFAFGEVEGASLTGVADSTLLKSSAS